MRPRLNSVINILDYKLTTYHAQRKCIGILGISLPLTLALGNILIESFFPPHETINFRIENSISDYYYTAMSGVFIGTLCSIGVFLINYHGPESNYRRDNVAGNIAGVSAFGVALFPTTPTPAGDFPIFISTIHFGSAAIFLLTLAYFSICLFTRTNPRSKPTEMKILRNKVYRSLGWIIITSLALCLITIIAMRQPAGQWLVNLNPIFWLETLAIWAFGWSWLIKGEAILRDEE